MAGGLEFGGTPYVRGAGFEEMGGPGSSSGRRGAGRERSAAVVEHRGILGAEYWVRLAEMEDWQRDRPGWDNSHYPKPPTLLLFFARLLQRSPREAQVDDTKPPPNLCGNQAAPRVVP